MMTNYVIIDTAFSSLTPEAVPISLGLVTLDGQAFYAESSAWRQVDCSDFVIRAVLPILDGPVYPLNVLGNLARRWLEGLGPVVVLLSDACEWDEPILVKILQKAGWPGNVRSKVDPSFSGETRVRST